MAAALLQAVLCRAACLACLHFHISEVQLLRSASVGREIPLLPSLLEGVSIQNRMEMRSPASSSYRDAFHFGRVFSDETKEHWGLEKLVLRCAAARSEMFTWGLNLLLLPGCKWAVVGSCCLKVPHCNQELCTKQDALPAAVCTASLLAVTFREVVGFQALPCWKG